VTSKGFESFRANPFCCANCQQKIIGDSRGDIVIRNQVIILKSNDGGSASVHAKCIGCRCMIALPVSFVVTLGG